MNKEDMIEGEIYYACTQKIGVHGVFKWVFEYKFNKNYITSHIGSVCIEQDGNHLTFRPGRIAWDDNDIKKLRIATEAEKEIFCKGMEVKWHERI